MLSKVKFNDLEATSKCANDSENPKNENKFDGYFSKFNAF